MKYWIVLLCSGLIVLLGACTQPEPTPTTTLTSTATTTPTPSHTPEPSPTALPVSAREILEQSAAVMREVESIHFEMDVEMKLEAFDIPISIMGDFQAPDRSQATISSLFIGRDREVISIGETEYFNISGNEWPPITGKTPFFFDPIKIITTLHSKINDLVLVGEESLDEVQVYHLKGTTTSGAFEEPGGEVKIDFWIAQEDGRLRQVAVEGDVDIPEGYPLIGSLREFATGGAPASVTLKLLEFNKPVSIEPPPLPPCNSETTLGTSGRASTTEGVFDVEVAFPSLRFDRMVFLTHPGNGTDRLFLVLQEGCILVIPNEESVSSAQVFLNIRDRVSRSGNDEGLLGLAFDPDYAANGNLYVYYCTPGPRRCVISRFSTSKDDPNRANHVSEEVILEIRQPFSNHNGGTILFGSDGMLYIGLGDGGAGGDPQGHGQNPSTLLGSLLRIDPRKPSEDRNYTIPPDNPFVGVSGFREEIWAYGLRNPWRYSFDRETDQLWLGDVGQNRWEEIDIITKGGNYGWNIMEGAHCFSPSVLCDETGLELPIVEYPNPGKGCSVTGGYVYRGSRLPSLYGAYIYGDFCSGRIWALRYDGQRVTDHALLVDSTLQISSFGEDQDGELYILSFDGRIYRLKQEDWSPRFEDVIDNDRG